jgi:hypothetical protein
MRIPMGQIDFSFDQPQAFEASQYAAERFVFDSCGSRQVVVPSLAASGQLEEHGRDPTARDGLDCTFR